jgi:5-methylcytosine-specific restriction endonuclease McrA
MVAMQRLIVLHVQRHIKALIPERVTENPQAIRFMQRENDPQTTNCNLIF